MHPEKLIAIDASYTATALAWRRGASIKTALLEGPKIKGQTARETVERLRWIVDHVVSVVTSSGANAVMLEGHAFGAPRLAVLAALHGAIKYGIHNALGVVSYDLPVATARLLAVNLSGFGKRSPKKEAVRMALRAAPPVGLIRTLEQFDALTDDEVDAVVLLIAGERLLGPKGLTAHQSAAVRKWWTKQGGMPITVKRLLTKQQRSVAA